MKKLFSIALVLIFAAGVVLAQTANKPVSTAAKTTTAVTKAANTATGTNKTADIKTLLTLTKSGELAVSMMQEMINAYRQGLPQVPDEFWLGFAKKVKTNDLVEMLVPIYDRHLTHSEVVSLIEFFGSPVGKKLISIQPSVMKESMQAGQIWGEKIGQQVTAELQKQGYR
ncbi:MAG TPA: DUF2059 domain-containing protein [candidate division Zixibacteria bacterium]|nr:DUF2059 domain-containing protein [candidate division Zixibacteria bacterium]